MQNSPVTQTAMGKTGDFLSHLRPPNILFGLIIFFSATQLGLHFWPLSSLVYGIRIDYLAPTVYLFDLLLLGYLVARRSDLPGRSPRRGGVMFSRTSKTSSETRSDLIVTLTPILLTNLLYSQNPLSTLSWSLHFLLYLGFISSLSSSINHRPLIIGLTLALLFQLLLALSQVSLGHSLGGLLYYLGERSVAVGQPEVALGTFMDSVVLRAYGTFGHPNVLAGWSVVVLFILIQISQTAIPKAGKQRVVRGSDPLRRPPRRGEEMFSRLQNAIWRPGQTLWVLATIFIVLLTQSRAAGLALFVLVIPFYLIKNIKMRLLYYSITLLLYYSFAPSLLTPPRADLSSVERRTLQAVSLKVIQNFPIFGTGAQASISTYPVVAPDNRLLQPDHNSFTLFLSWFGIFCVVAILYSLRPLIIHYSLFIIPLVPLLALDHYFLTSPQGLFIVLLLIFAKLVDN